MTQNTLNQDQYQQLLQDLRQIIALNIKKTEELARFHLISTYWQVGKKISELHLSSNASYSITIVEKLTKDLNLEKSTLKRSLQFFKTYPNKPQSSKLTWSHYKALVTIKNNDLRLGLEDKTKKEGWNVAKLNTAIANLKGQDMALLSKDNAGAENKTIKRPTDPNYLYKATIISVVDGDTLLLDVDLGFKVFKKQRVRLTHINAKEMGTVEGQKAFEYLQNLAVNLEIIAIKTNKIDIYGRYLADIFYLPSEVSNQTTQLDIFNDGVYLNQELVDKGLVDLF